jgi:hypothetical protein
MFKSNKEGYLNFINYFLFSIFFIILVYTFYKSEIIFNGKLRSHYIFYYIIFSTLLTITFLGILFKKKIPFTLFLIFSFFLNLYIFDFILAKEVLEDYKKKNNNKEYDLNKFVDLFEEHAENLDKISFAFPSNYYLTNDSKIFPLASGQSKVKTYLCNESGYWAIYESDRFGFRNNDKLWDQQIDVVSVGDSFLHGYCVNEGENISEIFNKKNNFTMLNLGVGGTGPLHQYAILKEYLKTVKSLDYVFWFYQESNDLTNIDDEFENETLKKYLKENFTQNLTLKQIDIDKMTKTDLKKNYLNKKYTIKKFLKLDNLKWFIATKFNSSKEYNLLNQTKESNKKRLNNLKIVLEKTKLLTNQHNAKLVFIYTPYYQRYLLDNKEKEKFRLKNEVLQLVNELELNYIDIDIGVFQKENNPLSFYPNKKHNHPNPEGYEKVADHILDVFSKIKTN